MKKQIIIIISLLVLLLIILGGNCYWQKSHKQVVQDKTNIQEIGEQSVMNDSYIGWKIQTIESLQMTYRIPSNFTASDLLYEKEKAVLITDKQTIYNEFLGGYYAPISIRPSSKQQVEEYKGILSDVTETPVTINGEKVILINGIMPSNPPYDEYESNVAFFVNQDILIEMNGVHSFAGGKVDFNVIEIFNKIISSVKFENTPTESARPIIDKQVPTFNWQQYTDDTYNFVISYPKEWERTSNDSSSGSEVVQLWKTDPYGPALGTDGQSPNSAKVSVSIVNSDLGFSELAEEINFDGTYGIYPVFQESILVNNREAVILYGQNQNDGAVKALIQHDTNKFAVITGYYGLGSEHIITLSQIRGLIDTFLSTNGWLDYRNEGLGVALRFPPQMLAYEWWDGNYKECESSESDQVLVPYQIFADDDEMYLKEQYYYDILSSGECAKVNNTFTKLKEKHPDRSEWHITILDIENESELLNFIKSHYASGCGIKEIKESKYPGTYDVYILGDGKDLGETTCPVNYITKMKYSESKGKLAYWDIGQECTRTYRWNPYSYCLDGIIEESFHFID